MLTGDPYRNLGTVRTDRQLALSLRAQCVVARYIVVVCILDCKAVRSVCTVVVRGCISAAGRCISDRRGLAFHYAVKGAISIAVLFRSVECDRLIFHRHRHGLRRDLLVAVCSDHKGNVTEVAVIVRELAGQQAHIGLAVGVSAFHHVGSGRGSRTAEREVLGHIIQIAVCNSVVSGDAVLQSVVYVCGMLTGDPYRNLGTVRTDRQSA